MESIHVVHPFKPVFDSNSKVLILGSLPSVRSREEGFYYGHPRNRFWPLMARLLQEPIPNSIDEKKALLLRNQIAIWDVIFSCDISGSMDSSIINAVPNDLNQIIQNADIVSVFCNGNTAGSLYRKYQGKELGISAVTLPSTSPANASFNMDRLQTEWQIIIGSLEK